MSQISDSEIEDIMIEIQRMNLNEIKEVNPIMQDPRNFNFWKKGKIVIPITKLLISVKNP